MLILKEVECRGSAIRSVPFNDRQSSRKLTIKSRENLTERYFLMIGSLFALAMSGDGVIKNSAVEGALYRKGVCFVNLLLYTDHTCWKFQIKELCNIVGKLSTHHRNLLYLVQIQPCSTYGIELQRRLSLTLLHWLVLKFVKQDQTGKRLVDERCDVTVPDKVEVIMQ